jgi:hypothetical protein
MQWMQAQRQKKDHFLDRFLVFPRYKPHPTKTLGCGTLRISMCLEWCYYLGSKWSEEKRTGEIQ